MPLMLAVTLFKGDSRVTMGHEAKHYTIHDRGIWIQNNLHYEWTRSDNNCSSAFHFCVWSQKKTSSQHTLTEPPVTGKTIIQWALRMKPGSNIRYAFFLFKKRGTTAENQFRETQNSHLACRGYLAALQKAHLPSWCNWGWSKQSAMWEPSLKPQPAPAKQTLLSRDKSHVDLVTVRPWRTKQKHPP